jgi:DNA-binding HxlR family transcriptional regulator
LDLGGRKHLSVAKKTTSVRKDFSLNFKEQTDIAFFSCLADHYALKILLIVTEKNQVSFSELKSMLGINANSLNRSIKKLRLWKMLSNDCPLPSIDERNHSFYKLTDFGRKLIKQLYELDKLLEETQVRIQTTAQDNLEEKYIEKCARCGSIETETVFTRYSASLVCSKCKGLIRKFSL